MDTLPSAPLHSNVTEEKKDEMVGIVNKTKNKRRPREMGNYSKMLITRKLSVNYIHIGSNIKQTLEKLLSKNIEGKCVVEGYIKSNSINILTYSSGLIVENNVLFDIAFECDVCTPVEGMHINCISKNITKAGIRAEIIGQRFELNDKYISVIAELIEPREEKIKKKKKPRIIINDE